MPTLQEILEGDLEQPSMNKEASQNISDENISDEIEKLAMEIGLVDEDDTAYDAIALEIEIRTPTNAEGFSFDFNFHTYEYPNFIFPKPGTNISNHFKIRRGNCAEAWDKCAHIVERTYRIPHIQHVPIEPHVAARAMDGRVDLHV